jgi:lysophospholipase L1-like esterase
MKYFYLYIFFLCIIIFSFAYFNTINFSEHFESNTKVIILLGDSILKNNHYVSDGKSIEDILSEKSNKQIFNYATDHSKIDDIYSQLSQIPLDLNSQNTSIFLSAGGNDILSYYVDQENDITNTSNLSTLFENYIKLINSIKDRLPNANLFLIDIYYPNNDTYRKYHSIISEWNEMIYKYANNSNNNITGIVKISSVVTQNEDFSFGIEPSSHGGKKIADSILTY